MSRSGVASSLKARGSSKVVTLKREEQLSLSFRSPAKQARTRQLSSRPRQPAKVRAPDMDQILNVADIERATGRNRCTVYRWMMEGRFPAKVVRDGRRLGWLRSEVEAWLHAPSETVPVAPLNAGMSRR